MAQEVLAWLESGKSLLSFCKQPEKPGRRTVHDWREKSPEFSAQFARAKELGNEVLEEECLDIADHGTNDWMEIQDKDGECVGWRVNGEAVQRSKVRIETRLKIIANRDPRRYGNKADEVRQTNESLALLIAQQMQAARFTTPLGSVSDNGNGSHNGNGNGHG